MLARVFSCAVIGLEGVIVEVEVDTGQGLPGMTIVGPKKTVQFRLTLAGVPYAKVIQATHDQL